MNSAGLGPVQPAQRILLLDALRGFALLGILQVNWANTTGWLSNQIDFFGDGSFYTSFSFLFGLGFALQMIQAEQVGRPFFFRYLWRTAILLAIGAGHFIFVWGGDILREYALIAPVLLLVRRLRPALVLTLAAAVLMFTMAPGIPPKGEMLRRVNPEHMESNRLVRQMTDATTQAYPPAWCQMLPGLTDAYRGLVCQRTTSFSTMVRGLYTDLSWWQGWDSSILSMFLLGLYVGRRRILAEAARYTRLLMWVGGVSLLIGLAGNALEVYGDFFEARGIALPDAVGRWVSTYYIGNIGLALFYLSSVTLVFTRWRLGARALAPLAKVGRLGLTNYLMQSILFSLILGPQGFDVMQRVTEGYSLLLINAFFVVQIFYSYWWLRHFHFGPAEWLWRSLTWWRLQPMRLAPQPALLEVQPVAGGTL